MLDEIKIPIIKHMAYSLSLSLFHRYGYIIRSHRYIFHSAYHFIQNPHSTMFRDSLSA